MLLRSLAGASTAIRVRPRADPRLLRWGLRFLRECTPSRFARNTVVKYELARYSQAATDDAVGE
ncbi:MAG: amino acid dehydrogenase, partial [Dehalococcoidia bacterium]